MGFDEQYQNHLVVSDTQAYRQFGNAVVPKVVEAVGKQILKVLSWRLTENGCLFKRAETNGHNGNGRTARRGERMTSPYCERAIEDALHYGNALLKFISPNNVGLTGSHECGFYLPYSVWEMYTPHPPVKGRNRQASDLHSLAGWPGNGVRGDVVRRQDPP